MLLVHEAPAPIPVERRDAFGLDAQYRASQNIVCRRLPVSALPAERRYPG